jgi:gliding motility-associated protein GldL
MRNNKKDFQTVLYKTVMPKVYGIGAAVVIFGAMFKLLNWPGSSLMLGLGLTTEALIFILSAFEPEHKEIEWERVYPELSDDYDGSVTTKTNFDVSSLLEGLKLDPKVIENLNSNLGALADSVKKLSVLSTSSVATEEYLKNISTATNTLKELNQLYYSALNSADMVNEMVKNAEQYNKSLLAATTSLSSLGNVYAKELDQAYVRQDNTSKLYDEVFKSVEDLKSAGGEVADFKIKLQKLKNNISSLSEIYENMLASIKQ